MSRLTRPMRRPLGVVELNAALCFTDRNPVETSKFRIFRISGRNVEISTSRFRAVQHQSTHKKKKRNPQSPLKYLKVPFLSCIFLTEIASSFSFKLRFVAYFYLCSSSTFLKHANHSYDEGILNSNIVKQYLSLRGKID